MSYLIDQYLLFRIRVKGDEQAFGKLYDRYVVAIYRFVFLKVSNKERAEDITSETFLRFWKKVKEGKDIGNVRAFLYQVARHLIVDAYRQAKWTQISIEAQSESVTFVGSYPSTIVETIQADPRYTADLVEVQADVSLLLSKISYLKEDFKDVLMLRLVDGLSFSDIAVILNKSTGHVRVIYHRAVKALRALGTSS